MFRLAINHIKLLVVGGLEHKPYICPRDFFGGGFGPRGGTRPWRSGRAGGQGQGGQGGQGAGVMGCLGFKLDLIGI